MTNEKLHEQAMKRFRRLVDAEKAIREKAREDIRMRQGDHWDSQVKAKRIADGRPALVFNKIPIYVQNVVNSIRQQEMEETVSPTGGGSTLEVANVMNGILRHIRYISEADVAEEMAADTQVGSSFGFIRAVTEYCGYGSTDQEIKILPVPDPFSVYGVIIPAALRQTVPYAFVVEHISRDEYEETYGDDNPVSFEPTEWSGSEDWLDDGQVRIAEYWWVDQGKKKLRLLINEDGSASPVYGENGKFPDGNYVMDPETGKPGEKHEMVPEVYFAKMDGLRIFPETITRWIGDSIPIQCALGQVVIEDGRVSVNSVHRFIQGSQCLLNSYKSGIAEKLGLMNRTPYIGYKGVFSDPKFEDAHLNNYPYLEAEAVILPDGSIAPLPRRDQVDEQITALSLAASQEAEDMKSGTGIFDASLGAASNVISGIGVENRTIQSTTTNYHFAGNLKRARHALTVQIVKIIHKIYDRPGRQVRIIGPDRLQDVVTINKPYTDDKGSDKHYPLDVGDYDVTVRMGKSFDGMQDEAAETLGSLFKAVPATFPILGDLYMGSLRYTWATEAARRLKAAAPQNIVQDEKDKNPIPPEVQQHLEKAAQTIKQLSQLLDEATDEKNAKKMELDSKERIVKMQEETKVNIALANLNHKEGTVLLEAELGQINRAEDAAVQAQVTAPVDQAEPLEQQ